MHSVTHWAIITTAALIGTAANLVAARKLQKQMRQVVPGYHSPLTQFFYSGETAKSVNEPFMTNHLALLRSFHIVMAAMVASACLCLLVVSHNISYMLLLTNMMYWVTLPICVTGVGEALLLTKHPRTAACLGIAKWAAFALWTACLFVHLFIQAFQM